MDSARLRVVNCKRPSIKELDGKLRSARVLLNDGWQACDVRKLAANFYELELFTADEQNQALITALTEVSATQYAGAHPPEKSYEKTTQGLELFSFCWESLFFGRRMYLKFAIRSPNLYVFSLHPSRGKEDE